MARFGEVLTAMVTPFNDDLSLDLDGAVRLARWLVEQGNDGLVVAGTTGETPTITDDEQVDLAAAVAEAVTVPVLVGTGSNDTAHAVEMTAKLDAIGAAGALVVSPYYNRPPQAGIEAHFRAVAAASDLPVMVYNVPSRTANEIAPETLLTLATEVDTIVALKDAVSDTTKAAWLAARKPEGFAVYAGNDADLLPLLALGATGVVSVASHLVGREMADLVELFPTDPAKAREIHLRLLPLYTALFADTSPAPLKAALRLVGLPAGPLRLPLVDVEGDVVDLLRQALAAVGVPVAGAEA